MWSFWKLLLNCIALYRLEDALLYTDTVFLHPIYISEGGLETLLCIKQCILQNFTFESTPQNISVKTENYKLHQGRIVVLDCIVFNQIYRIRFCNKKIYRH